MKPSLRTVLIESHVAIIAIAMLLGQGVMWLFQIVWVPVSQAIGILIDAVEYPYAHHTFSGILGLQSVYMSLGEAIPCFVIAWVVSRFVFSAGPFEALIAYRARIWSNG